MEMQNAETSSFHKVESYGMRFFESYWMLQFFMRVATHMQNILQCKHLPVTTVLHQSLSNMALVLQGTVLEMHLQENMVDVQAFTLCIHTKLH